MVSLTAMNAPLPYSLTVGHSLLKRKASLNKRSRPVTVCIAAICNAGMTFGASDRMITYGDIEFEPRKSKIIPLTRSLVAMTAGDASLQTEIVQETFRIINSRVQERPKDWWNVKDAVQVYIDCYGQIKRRLAAQKILRPLGLDSESFLQKQGEMARESVSQITSELIRCRE
jgi:hypothetical protein